MASGSTSSGCGGGSVPAPGRVLISTGSPSAAATGSAPLLRRGLVSCLHSLACCADDGPLLSDRDLPQAMNKLIVGFYDEAFGRLPCKDMPDLLGLLTTGGFCLGLLDPVSNIILNTIAVLPRHAAAAAAAPPGGTKKRSRPGFDPWHEISIRSYQSMLAFLMAYFGFLTKVQAARYVYRANANVLLAVMLVNHDFYKEGEEAMLESDRVQAALKWAATIGGHPSPATLARLMAIRLNTGDDLDLMERQFSADGRATALTVEDVRAVHRILRLMMTPMGVANVSHTSNGLVVHVRQNLKASWSQPTPPSVSTAADVRITSTTFCWDGTPISALQFGLPNKLQDCLQIAHGQKQILKSLCGDSCDYVQSLNMYLLGIIHNLYAKALKMLPTLSGSLMRSIIKAGHCYGSCDPLSNIILNTIWYDICGSFLPVDDRRKFSKDNDILDPRSLLRPVAHSLKGLIKIALFVDPQSSTASAMERLCRTKCTVVVDTSSSAREGNPFHEAAVAAGHPLPLQLGELHRLLQLMPEKRSLWLSHITKAQTSGGLMDVHGIKIDMSDWWFRSSEVETHTKSNVQAPQLSVAALRVVTSRRLEYEERRTWFRSKIELLLQDYTDEHFSGSNYKLDTIVAVEEINQGLPPLFDMCYRANFMATSDPKLQRTLFFAEFWSSRKRNSEFCCPLPYPYAGRCYYGVTSARKIVYPDDAKYIPYDITRDGTGSVDGILEMDLVYFSSETDVELAGKLNMLASEEESESQ